MMRWWVYALCDPVTDEVRYIGKTFRWARRIAEHLRPKQPKSHLGNWLRSLMRRGLKPKRVLLDAGRGDGHGPAERAWIQEYRSQGANLVNATDGGEGTPGKIVSDETKAKIGRANRESPRAAAHRAALAEKRRGMRFPPEVRARMGESRRGKKRSNEHRANLSAALKGHKHSEETLAKLSEAAKKSPKAAAHRARLAEKRRGHKMTPEQCERYRLAALKRWAKKRECDKGDQA